MMRDALEALDALDEWKPPISDSVTYLRWLQAKQKVRAALAVRSEADPEYHEHDGAEAMTDLRAAVEGPPFSEAEDDEGIEFVDRAAVLALIPEGAVPGPEATEFILRHLRETP